METDGHGNGSCHRFVNSIESEKSIHVLFVPMVSQAHFVTAFRLAKKLSQRGVAITLVVIKQHSDELYRIYTRVALKKLGINVEALDGYQSPTPPNPYFMSPALRAAFQPFAEKLIANKKAGLPGPTCLLGDRLLHWIADLGKELDIPRYSFSSNAAVMNKLMKLQHELDDEMRAIPQGPDWLQKRYQLICKQPGFEFFKKATDLPESIRASDGVDFACNNGQALSSADGILINTFYALEHEFIGHMRNAFPGTGSTKVKVVPLYPIGPLSTTGEFNNETFIEGLEDSHAECVEWLGTQPPHSVLYICLGSKVRLFSSQISNLARALEGSQQRFLWVLTRGGGNFNNLNEVLPAGFLERLNGRGKIVTGWVGQLELLSNPAIGGFVSHCGWQSIMESLTCGVPILGWPHIAEQGLNCRYMRDVLKVGMRVTEKDTQELVEQHEFEEAIHTFMSEKGRTVVAENAAKMKEMATAAVAEGGPSDIALDQFVQSIILQSRRKTEQLPFSLVSESVISKDSVFM